MQRSLADYRVFFGEFFRAYHTTGAVLPSSPLLARALARYVNNRNVKRRILEVGPGTGAVTQRIIARLGAEDRFDLVEINERFVECLRQRFETDPPFQVVADRVTIVHDRVERLSGTSGYDVIVSGLPLNNFSVAELETILGAMRNLLAPGGILSFFEYVAIRPLRSVVSRAGGRARLKGIGLILRDLLKQHEIRREFIWPNVPPACVHHICFSRAACEESFM